MLSAILFDLDGTLVNSDPLHFQIWKEILMPFGFSLDKAFYRHHISGRTNLEIVQDLLPQLSPDEGIQLSEEKETRFRDLACQLQPLPGLTELLHWVEAAKLKRAIVSNAPRLNAEFFLRVLQLQDFFPVVVLAEDVSAGKPHPAPYQEALRQLAVEAKNAIALEDSPSGIQSAVSAGLLTIGVTSTHPPEHLKQAGATFIINDFSDSQLWRMIQEESQKPS